MKYSNPVLIDHLSSSYVLGTLSGAARRRFERLQRDRADVRLAVARWEGLLGELAQVVPGRQPSPRVWAVIEARTRPSLVQPPRPGHARWLRPAGWGLGGLASGLLAATLLFLAVPGLFVSTDQLAMRTGEQLPQSYVGLLTDAQGQGKLLVSSLRHGRTLTVKVIGPVASPAQGRLVLWAVPANAPAFVLGPVPTSGSALSQLPDTSERLLSKVQKLVVTLETADKPTTPGTVVYSGNCAKLW